MGDVGSEVRQPADGTERPHHRDRSPGAPPPWDPGKVPQTDLRSLPPGCSGGGEERGPQGCLRWACDLRSLLCDHEGLQLLEAFLEQEGADTGCLSFWYACNGFRSCDDPEVKLQYMRSIYKNYIRKHVVELSPATRAEIEERIKEGSANSTTFDRAQREFESFLERDAYPKFLQSDLYVERVEQTHARLPQASSSAPPRVAVGRSPAAASNVCTAVDSQCSVAVPGPSSGLTCEPASSSGCEDGSGPVLLPQGLDILPTLREDEELGPEWPPPAAALTRRNVRKMYRYSDLVPRLAKAASDVPVAMAVSARSGTGGGGVPNPYHVRNSYFVPPSAQDSELHSLSSGAYTDDTSTEVDANPPTKETRSQRASQGAAIRKNANINRDSLGEHVIIPRTQMDHPYSLAEKDPAQFAASIIEKLRAVKKQADCGEKMERFHRAQAEDFPNARLPSGGAAATASTVPGQQADPAFCAEKFLGLAGEEVNSQSILDEHVSRVFDSPLTQTPPRSTSPRRRAAAAASMSPYAVLGHQLKLRKERDACSSDSGAVRDFSPDEDGLPHGVRRRAQGPCGGGGGGGGVPNAPLARAPRGGPQPSDSGLDSGTSAACEPLPAVQGSAERVNTWILNHKVPGYPLSPPDGERDSRSHKKSATSGTSSRSKQNSLGPTRSRPFGGGMSGCGSVSGSGWGPGPESGFQPSQQQPLDTMTQLVEARRRLEVNYPLAVQQAAKTKKWPKTSSSSSRGSVPEPLPLVGAAGGGCTLSAPNPGIRAPSPPLPSEATVIGYCYSGETVPYRTKLAGRNITLRQFKALLSKKGNYRYFFRCSCHEFGTEVVSQEISDDNEVLPLWEGKIFATVVPLD